MLDDLHGRGPQITTQIGLDRTQVLHLVAALELSPGHRRGELDGAVALGVVDGQCGQIKCVGDDPAETHILKDDLDGWDEIAQLKILIPGELVFSGLV